MVSACASMQSIYQAHALFEEVRPGIEAIAGLVIVKDSFIHSSYSIDYTHTVYTHPGQCGN